MSLIRKHGAVLQAWACLDLVRTTNRNVSLRGSQQHYQNVPRIAVAAKSMLPGGPLVRVNAADDTVRRTRC